jgi:hypothetical protein
LRVGLDKLAEILISKDVRRRRGEIYLALDYATSGFFSPWRPPRLFVPQNEYLPRRLFPHPGC